MKIHYLTHFKKNQKNEFLDINFTPFEKNYEECGFKNNDESFNFNNYSTSEWDEMIKGINQENITFDNSDKIQNDDKMENYDFNCPISSINEELNSCIDS